MSNPLIRIENQTTSKVVCSSAERAVTWLSRLRGLLGTSGLPAEGGLLLCPSSGVHTFGMRYAIDIVALDRELRVLAIWQRVGPGKVRALGFRTHAVLELDGGAAARTKLKVGDCLAIFPAAAEVRDMGPVFAAAPQL